MGEAGRRSGVKEVIDLIGVGGEREAAGRLEQGEGRRAYERGEGSGGGRNLSEGEPTEGRGFERGGCLWGWGRGQEP